MNNPYTLVFGREPAEMISRRIPESSIINTFMEERPSQQVFILTGVRGCGKTVMMTEISRQIQGEKDWITVELNPERDMLLALAAKLASEDRLSQIFKNAQIDLSFFGIGVTIKNASPITDIEIALERMLESLKKHGKKVLITVDEAVNNEYIRVFASSFQIFVRKELPVFLLMTGLYENIQNIQNEKTLTFLYRAPKIEVPPLNIGSIADNYQKNFKLSDEKALEMARLTKGYSFAFQVLGHLTWEKEGDFREALPEYKQYLEEYSYEKIWSEMSRTDQRVAYAIARSKDGRIREIRETLGMETNQFNPYRKRLIRKGILDGSTHGLVRFTLPYFDRFVMENYSEGIS